MKEKSLKLKIKEMEAAAKKEQEQVEAIDPDSVLNFDQWWVMLSRRISVRHSLKEVMWADFKSRGLSKLEPISKYEECLKLFGL